MEETAMETRDSRFRVGGGSGGSGQLGSPRQISVNELLDITQKQVEELNDLISILGDKVDVVCMEVPEKTELREDSKEPNMSRPDERLMMVNSRLDRLASKIRRLNSRINI